MAESADDAGHTPRDEWLIDLMGRQSSVLHHLRHRAAAATDEAAACLAWMGVARQSGRTLGIVSRWGRSRGYARAAEQIDAHRAELERFVAESGAALATFDEPTRREAAGKVGLRLVIVGKGGAGKTVLAGTLARVLARRGRKVLAADLDTNPGLAFSVGAPHLAGGLPPEAVEQHKGAAYGWQLRSGISPQEAVERFSDPAPEGVRFISLGKIDAPEKQAARQSLNAILQILRGFGEPDWDVIGDMEAGPTTPFERYYSFADRALVVVGPAWRSGMTARRLVRMIDDLPTTVVASRYRDDTRHAGIDPVFHIPLDRDVTEGERQGLAPIDFVPGSPVVAAVEELAHTLLTPAWHDPQLLHR